MTMQEDLQASKSALGATPPSRPTGLSQLIRSPLGMEVLTGKFEDGRVVPERDVRFGPPDWQDYFDAGRPRTDLAWQIAAVRELLTFGGRP